MNKILYNAKNTLVNNFQFEYSYYFAHRFFQLFIPCESLHNLFPLYIVYYYCFLIMWIAHNDSPAPLVDLECNYVTFFKIIMSLFYTEFFIWIYFETTKALRSAAQKCKTLRILFKQLNIINCALICYLNRINYLFFCCIYYLNKSLVLPYK